ncbi:flavin reductase [Aquibacillus halophilus]|uniref:Flavin reductase n=1 Tax=Aquibacillus halophilus TaxID=930132 RepID=A0A6A8DFN3_9BACI|nr:flavin reductase family protein [Aquibacillus halophilus]MRH42591.1 flavin reductase [Aquibacillus halophilus]
MDNQLFRNAMGRFATGITVVTTEYKGEIHGMTVNAFMSVSLDPKLIAISIDEQATMYDKLQETKKFGLSILTEQQKDLSMIFAKQKEADQEIEYEFQDSNPVLKDSLATLSCTVQDMAKAGDHLIFIAEVSEVKVNSGDPILYYGGQYRETK